MVENAICYSALLRLQILITIFSGYLAQDDHSGSLASRHRRQVGGYNFGEPYRPSSGYTGSSYQNRVSFKARTSGNYGPDLDYSRGSNYPTGRYGQSSDLPGRFDNRNDNYGNNNRPRGFNRNNTNGLNDNYGDNNKNRGNSYRNNTYGRNDDYGDKNKQRGNSNRNSTYGRNDNYGDNNKNRGNSYRNNTLGRNDNYDQGRGRQASSYGRNDYNNQRSSFRSSSYDNNYKGSDYRNSSFSFNYDDKQPLTCPKCPDCPPTCNITDTPAPNGGSSPIVDYQELVSACNDTIKDDNTCLRPSVPFRCTSEQCTALEDSFDENENTNGVKIFPPSDVSVSQCIFRKTETLVFSYNVCQRSGSYYDLTPDNTQNIDCAVPSNVNEECFWATDGAVFVRSPGLCLGIQSLTVPITVQCSLFFKDNGDVFASASVNVTIYPDCRCNPCPPDSTG